MARVPISAWARPFDPNAEYVWATSRDGQKAGQPLPAQIARHRTKMLSLYKVHRIVAREHFPYDDAEVGPSADDAVPTVSETPEPVKEGRHWVIEGTDERFPTKTAALEYLAALANEE